MSRIGCREIYFVNAMQPRQVDFIIDKAKTVVEEMGTPQDYDIRIYKNVFSCCGLGGLGLIIEVVGPEEDKIKAIDLRAVAKILELCEREGYTIGHHSVGQYETI